MSLLHSFDTTHTEIATATEPRDRYPVDLDAYLDNVIFMLASHNPLDLVIALAAITGQSFMAVISLGQIERCVADIAQLIPQRHPYLMHFTGQRKANVAPYDLLTLVPVHDVTLGIEKLRSKADIRDLAGLTADDPQMEGFKARVNRRVVKILGEVLPTPQGVNNLAIHHCRAVYVSIALHYFYPNNREGQRLAQRLLGHVLLDDTTTGQASATSHDTLYYLTRQGKPLTARGVKLAASGPLPLTLDEDEVPVTPASAVEASSPAVEAPVAPAPSPTDPQGDPGEADPRPEQAMTTPNPQVDGSRGDDDPLWVTISTQAQTISLQAATIDRLVRSSSGRPDESAALKASQAEQARLRAMLDELKAIAADPNQFQAAQRFFDFDFDRGGDGNAVMPPTACS